MILLFAVQYFVMMLFDLFQLTHPLFHRLKRTLQILIRAHIFTKDINVDFLFVQHIGIHKILDVIDGFKGQRLGYQTEKLIFNTSQTGQHHFSGLCLRFAPLLNSFICGPEFRYGTNVTAIQEHIVRNLLIIDQIPNRGLLSLRSRIHYCADNKIALFTFFIKFQRHMRTELPGPLIRLILPACLTTDIARQLALTVFMSRFIKRIGRTVHHKLNRVQKCGFSGAVFTGNQGRTAKINGTIREPMPVNQLQSRQLLHSSPSPFCMLPVSHEPDGYPPPAQPSE